MPTPKPTPTDLEKQESRHRLLSGRTASATRSITDAVVMKNGPLFFLFNQGGDVPLPKGHGFGLYYNDCRYLDGYEMRISGRIGDPLLARSEQSAFATVQLANPELSEPDFVPASEIGIRWSRALDVSPPALVDKFGFTNYDSVSRRVRATLTFTAGFEDIYVVRGLADPAGGKMHLPVWKGDALCFSYDGIDGVARRLEITPSRPPDERGETSMSFDMDLEPRSTGTFDVALVIREGNGDGGAPAQSISLLQEGRRDALAHCLARMPEVHSDSLLLNSAVRRSFEDLDALRTTRNGESFIAAGVPWFVTPFGRDLMLTSLQLLPFDCTIAEQALRLVARYQGRRHDAWTEEEPGKIFHELRWSELAKAGRIPYTPFYGTIDATILFLLVVARHARWTGTLDLFRELADNVDRALAWADAAEEKGGGFVAYESMVHHNNLVNQGWKDSGDAVLNPDGTAATPPIAMVEVQAYLVSAREDLADIFERSGDGARAERLRHQAAELRSRLNQRFWSPDDGFMWMALQNGGRPVPGISSNPGHALWTGAVDSDKAAAVADRMMKPDMFNGWGIRTLASGEWCYNPSSYHLGSVWPHDSAILADGLRRYGHDEAAMRLVNGILHATMRFRDYRLPELFAGFGREDYHVPVNYPVACHPQAWAATAIPYLVQISLGLDVNGFEKRLTLRRPLLPDFIDVLKVRRLRVAGGDVDLTVSRKQDGVSVEAHRADGIQVTVI